MPAKQKTFDDCLSAFSEDQRAALDKLRKVIRAAAPKAEECVSYGLAAFRLDGRRSWPSARGRTTVHST